ncbi:MAG: carbohydrate-binding domain-containing protein [Lachnospiraceae bacterium]|nr:carbohydrate-binding domain-containing protein [Lachnospiraceae bacterium]
MKKTRKLLAKLMVFALILAYIPTPAENVSAASDKVTTKKYTLSKKAGTYTSAFKLTIKAVKGYKVYYSTGSNLNIKKVVKSGKKKTIKISKTTTLKIYAVKKSATITKKKLKTSTVKKKTKSYKYVISTSTGTDSATNNTNDTSTTTNTDSSNANTANTNNSNSTTNTNSSSSNASTATDTATNSDGANTDSSSTGTNDSADQSSSEAGEQPGNQNQDTPPTPPDGSQEQDTPPTPPDGNNGETSDTSGQKSQEDAQSEIDTAVDTATDTTKEAEEAVTGTTPLTDESVESIDLSTLSSLESTNVEISTEDNTTKITIKNTGKYELSGSVTDTIIEVPKSVKDTVEIDLNGVTIDDSSLTASPVINSTNAPLVINLNGNSTITGSGYVTENDVVTKTANAIIYNKKAPITITGDGTLNIIDPNFNNDATYNDDVDPSDGIASKDSVIIESGTVTVKANGDALKGTGSGTYDYTDISDTDANYYDADGNLDWDSYYAQAVTDGKYTTNSDETITVNYPCTYESGGITINGGTLNLSSALGKGISSKNGLVTITDGQININSADHAISAKNYNVQITGGTINIGTGENECGGDGIKAGDTARITGGNVTIGNCYGDGIQAENVVIADGTLNIKTYYEYANTNFCKTNSVLTALNISGYNTSSENESTGLKTESVVYDTGSHKAIKAGTKEKTFTYGEITDSESDYEAGKTYYQAASGGLTITGGTITLDTTNSGIKYNGNGDSQTIIGSPDDAIHSNNDATISGGTIDIYSSDDGISVVNNLYFLNDASVKVNTAYEGIEASNIVMGTTDTDFAPTVSVYSNDDGINAAKKNKVNYVYADDTEVEYTKTSYKTSGNSLTVNAGELTVEIGDDTTHSVTLINKGDSKGTTYNYSADGDGIDCNGSFYAYGGTIITIGGTSGGNGVFDRDGDFVIGEGVTLFGIGSSGMVEGPTTVNQPYIQYSASSSGRMNGMGGRPGNTGSSGSSSIASGSTITINDSTGNTLYTYTTKKTAGYILYSSPNLVSGSSYTIKSGTTTLSTVSASTSAASSGGGNNAPTPPGQQ